jgi:hypothetical protein
MTEWSGGVLEQMMARLGFSRRWIDLIMKCVDISEVPCSREWRADGEFCSRARATTGRPGISISVSSMC